METKRIEKERYNCYGIHRPTTTDDYKKYTLRGLFSLLENDGNVHEVLGEDGFHVVSRENDYVFDAGVLTDLVLFRMDRSKRKKEHLEQKV